jgi:methionyl-tRNA formyltransferase
MRLIFAGTPEFARVALAQLHAAGFEIALVLTQPDRPAGRGLKLQASPVKQWAVAEHIPVAQPRSLRLDGKYPQDAAEARAAIDAAQADAMVVAAYGLILPQWVLDLMEGHEASAGAARANTAETHSFPPGRPKENGAPSGGSEAHEVASVGANHLGCLNIHASLLPRWRGAAPIHRAIEAGDAQTGVTIMQMDAGLDTGDMLLVQALPIEAQDSTETLHDKLAELGGRMIVQALELAGRGQLRPVPQHAGGVSYAHKIGKQEAAIDWREPAAVLARRIRAFNPFPVASSMLGSETIKFWRAGVLPGAPAGAVAGEVLAAGPEGVDIATVDSVLRVTRLQKAGGKPMEAADFLRGFQIPPGSMFTTAV